MLCCNKKYENIFCVLVTCDKVCSCGSLYDRKFNQTTPLVYSSCKYCRLIKLNLHNKKSMQSLILFFPAIVSCFFIYTPPYNHSQYPSRHIHTYKHRHTPTYTSTSHSPHTHTHTHTYIHPPQPPHPSPLFLSCSLSRSPSQV